MHTTHHHRFCDRCQRVASGRLLLYQFCLSVCLSVTLPSSAKTVKRFGHYGELIGNRYKTFEWDHIGPPSPTPFPPIWGSSPPIPKLTRHMAPKRSNIAYWFKQTNYAHCNGLSLGTTLDPLTPPFPPNWGTVPHAKFVLRFAHKRREIAFRSQQTNCS
jgi:hypothetical protein